MCCLFLPAVYLSKSTVSLSLSGWLLFLSRYLWNHVRLYFFSVSVSPLPVFVSLPICLCFSVSVYLYLISDDLVICFMLVFLPCIQFLSLCCSVCVSRSVSRLQFIRCSVSVPLLFCLCLTACLSVPVYL
jgi:hypothetical protein